MDGFPKALMHPHFKWGLLVIVLVIIFLAVFRGGKEEPAPVDPDPAPGPAPAPAAPAGSDPEGREQTGLSEDLSGNYLAGYGAAGSDPLRDLVLLNDVVTFFQYSVKVPDALPTSGNREIAAALVGENAYRMRFVTPEFEFLNEAGEITDRWGTPLYFHFVEASEVGIRSAGPDRIMWTADDLQHGEHSGELQ